MVVPPLDGLDLLPQFAPGPVPALLGLVRDAEFLEPILEPGIESAGHRPPIGDRVPGPVPERLLVRDQIAAGDGDPHWAEPGGQLPGVADLSREQLRVDRAAVEVAKRDPTPGQKPVQLEDPAHEIRIGLLPEWKAALIVQPSPATYIKGFYILGYDGI